MTIENLALFGDILLFLILIVLLVSAIRAPRG